MAKSQSIKKKSKADPVLGQIYTQLVQHANTGIQVESNVEYKGRPIALWKELATFANDATEFYDWTKKGKAREIEPIPTPSYMTFIP